MAIEQATETNANSRIRARRIGRILKRYYLLPSRIQSIQLQLDRVESNLLVSEYEYDTVKSGSGTKDPVSRIVELKDELALLEREQQILENLRSVLPNELLTIWECLYNPRCDYSSIQIAMQLGVSERLYYKLKNDLLDSVEYATLKGTR